MEYWVTCPVLKHSPQGEADVIQLSFCVLDRLKSFWGRLMYFINPHGSLCFAKTVGSIKNIQSFRFPHLILFIQLQGTETSRIQFVLQSWSWTRLARDWESALYTKRERERVRGGGRVRWREQLLTSVRPPQVSRVLDCVSEATHKYFIGFFVMLRVDRGYFFPWVNQWGHNLQEHEWKYSAAFNNYTLFLSEKDESFRGLHCLLLDQKQACSCWEHPYQTLQCINSEFTVGEQAGDTVTHWYVLVRWKWAPEICLNLHRWRCYSLMLIKNRTVTCVGWFVGWFVSTFI